MATISDIVGGGNEQNGDKDKVLMPPPKSTTNSTTPATQFPVGLGLKVRNSIHGGYNHGASSSVFKVTRIIE